jgi:hypothetical protein
MRTRGTLTTAAALLFAASGTAFGVPAAAASPAQPGWEAWLGCWEQVGSDTDQQQLVCVLPGADEGSVRMATVTDGVITDETLLIADGVARPVDDEGCTGTETAFFSHDQRRVFTRAELECRGVQRVSTGVLALISESEWIDAQALTVAGQSAARTVRYRAVPRADTPPAVAALLPADQRLATEAARLHAAAALDIDAVVEASRAVAAPALEALLGARQQGFSLNARTIAQLAESGVETSTIDVMIALSYPARFAVREQDPDAQYAAAQDRDDRLRSECRNPALSRRYSAACYGFGYGSTMFYDQYAYGRYGYSPWGYDRYGWHYGRSPVIIVQPQPGTPTPRGGSVVKGRGFTAGDQPSRGTAQPRTQSPQTSSGTDRSSASSGSSSSGSSATTQSSSGSSTGRTARPRSGGDPGGNDSL